MKTLKKIGMGLALAIFAVSVSGVAAAKLGGGEDRQAISRFVTDDRGGTGQRGRSTILPKHAGGEDRSNRVR